MRLFRSCAIRLARGWSKLSYSYESKPWLPHSCVLCRGGQDVPAHNSDIPPQVCHPDRSRSSRSDDLRSGEPALSLPMGTCSCDIKWERRAARGRAGAAGGHSSPSWLEWGSRSLDEISQPPVLVFAPSITAVILEEVEHSRSESSRRRICVFDGGWANRLISLRQRIPTGNNWGQFRSPPIFRPGESH